MSDAADGKTPVPPRIIKASRYRGGTELLGSVNILAYTKHGTTSMVSVEGSDKLNAGDVLKTDVWILSAKHFVVVQLHKKPMKIPGTWYEVKVIAAPK